MNFSWICTKGFMSLTHNICDSRKDPTSPDRREMKYCSILSLCGTFAEYCFTCSRELQICLTLLNVHLQQQKQPLGELNIRAYIGNWSLSNEAWETSKETGSFILTLRILLLSGEIASLRPCWTLHDFLGSKRLLQCHLEIRGYCVAPHTFAHQRPSWRQQCLRELSHSNVYWISYHNILCILQLI